MDMSAAKDLLARKVAQKAGSQERMTELPVMLAVLSAQQATGFTAMRVREGNPPESQGDEPGRMTAIFSPTPAMPGLARGLAGSFNAAVAARLSSGRDGESDVYSGI
jgi:hypothetical protein